MKKSSAGFAPIIIILGIVLLLGIVGGAYYFGKNSSTAVKNNPVIIPTPTSIPTATPKVDETANWKTYVNTKYGFSFKYPLDFEIDTASGNPIDTGKIFRISFLSLDKKDTLSIMTALAEADFIYARKTYGFEGMKNISDSSIKVGSFDTEITLTDSETDKTPVGLDKISSYNVVVKDKLLVIEYGGKAETISLQKLKQILSTFKFTDTNVESGKYTCPANGYENCMPILDAEGQKQCSKEALDWKKANCPNFTGAAY